MGRLAAHRVSGGCLSQLCLSTPRPNRGSLAIRRRQGSPSRCGGIGKPRRSKALPQPLCRTSCRQAPARRPARTTLRPPYDEPQTLPRRPAALSTNGIRHQPRSPSTASPRCANTGRIERIKRRPSTISVLSAMADTTGRARSLLSRNSIPLSPARGLLKESRHSTLGAPPRKEYGSVALTEAIISGYICRNATSTEPPGRSKPFDSLAQTVVEGMREDIRCSVLISVLSPQRRLPRSLPERRPGRIDTSSASLPISRIIALTVSPYLHYSPVRLYLASCAPLCLAFPGKRYKALCGIQPRS